ncbi:hypothetical protein [Burkholderia seminalis]|uniref:hypothetical protein n=1 Tax=Burkholderia seminalis TaxID=488731 RepID=UPI0015899642|nr:hypothetical protein [Burkholderia seminalis]MDN7589863.1 hypothetical protein [Burkholderia seminalis]
MHLGITAPGCNADGNRGNRVSPDRKLLNTNGWCDARVVFASISKQTFATEIFIRRHWKSTRYPVLYRRSNSGSITEYFDTVPRKRFVKSGYTPDGRTKLMQQCRADALFDMSTSPENGKIRHVVSDRFRRYWHGSRRATAPKPMGLQERGTQSDGMAGQFVNKMTRDYVAFMAETVAALATTDSMPLSDRMNAVVSGQPVRHDWRSGHAFASGEPEEPSRWFRPGRRPPACNRSLPAITRCDGASEKAARASGNVSTDCAIRPVLAVPGLIRDAGDAGQTSATLHGNATRQGFANHAG